MSTTLRVSEATRARAAAIAAATGVSIGTAVDNALDAYERAEFWRQTREALRTLPVDPDDELWDRTSGDGLASE